MKIGAKTTAILSTEPFFDGFRAFLHSLEQDAPKTAIMEFRGNDCISGVFVVFARQVGRAARFLA